MQVHVSKGESLTKNVSSMKMRPRIQTAPSTCGLYIRMQPNSFLYLLQAILWHPTTSVLHVESNQTSQHQNLHRISKEVYKSAQHQSAKRANQGVGNTPRCLDSAPHHPISRKGNTYSTQGQETFVYNPFHGLIKTCLLRRTLSPMTIQDTPIAFLCV